MALVDVHEVLVDPAVGSRALVVEGLLVRAPADVAHLADAAPLHSQAALTEPLGQPGLPYIRRLHHVVVDADDPGELAVARHAPLQRSDGSSDRKPWSRPRTTVR